MQNLETSNPESLSFKHYQTAHCESGVTKSLFCNNGLRINGSEISEAMVFGIGSGLFFAHVPFAKVMNIPLTTFRSFPGTIFNKTCKRLKIKGINKTFRNMDKGNAEMNALLASGIPVGVRANIYWLSYIPEQFRFQFNAHNLVVYKRNQDSTYQVSDPILERTEACDLRDLNRARFAKGILAPKGLIYYPEKREGIHEVDLQTVRAAIYAGIKEATNAMLFAPMPFVGVRGIRFLAKQTEKWFKKFKDDPKKLKLYMANVVRMQEEIGTGGAGFRFLYAAFLKEAGEITGSTCLIKASGDFLEVGKMWREYATETAKFCKDRGDNTLDVTTKILNQIAEKEKEIFQSIRREYIKGESYH